MSQDREFDTYMQGKSDLSDVYANMPQIGPPDHLDAAILAEAHRAVGARPEARPKRRWMLPLSMAASVLVAVMAGLQLPYLLKDSAAPQSPPEERADVAAMDKMTGAAPPAPALAARKSQAPVAPNAPVMQEAAKLSPAAGNRLEVAPAAAAAPVPAKTAAPAPAAEAAAAEAPAAAQAPAPAMAAKPERLMQQAEPPPAGVLSKEKKSSARAEGYLSDRLEQRPSAAAAEVAPEPMQREAKPLGSIKEEAGGANQSPEAWLIRIKRLKQEGRLDEARKELAAFKKRYPGYTVPPDLEVR